MFKKLLCIICSFLLIAGLFCGCSEQNNAPHTDPDSVNYIGEIANVSGSVLLVCGCDDTASSGELYTVGIASKEIVDANGAVVSPDQLKVGMKVSITYSGHIQATFPSHFDSVTKITVLEEGDDLVSMYLEVLKSLYESSPGLNSDIEMISIDLTKTTNLTNAQKSALTYLCWNEFDIEPYNYTHKQLCDEGLINEETLTFEKGILFEIGVNDEPAPTDRKFEFYASKWRSGDGAVDIHDCVAKCDGGVWSYRIGTNSVS